MPGIPAVTLEAGEPGRLQSAQVREGTAGIVRLLDALRIVNRMNLLTGPRPVYYRSTWVRSDYGGILFSLVRLGQVVSSGDILGTVTDPVTNSQNLIYSPGPRPGRGDGPEPGGDAGLCHVQSGHRGRHQAPTAP